MHTTIEGASWEAKSCCIQVLIARRGCQFVPLKHSPETINCKTVFERNSFRSAVHVLHQEHRVVVLAVLGAGQVLHQEHRVVVLAVLGAGQVLHQEQRGSTCCSRCWSGTTSGTSCGSTCCSWCWSGTTSGTAWQYLLFLVLVRYYIRNSVAVLAVLGAVQVLHREHRGSTCCCQCCSGTTSGTSW